MLEKIPSYRYDQQIEKWVKATSIATDAKLSTPLRIATFNVLTDNFPWFIELCIQSEKRFKAACKMIEALDVDIIGFNEATSTFLAELMENETIRSRYYFSDINIDEKIPGWFNYTANKSLGKRMGNLILSKIPFVELYRYAFDSQNAKATRETTLIGRFNINSSDLLVCSVHLTAYENQIHTRKAQLAELDQVLKSSFDTVDVIAMGDMNLHNQSENSMIAEFGYRDLWAETHFSNQKDFNDGDEGITFDVNANSMIPYYIPCEKRRMRLDRILIWEKSNWIPASPMKIFANQPIDSNSYLYLSDHFGLMIDMKKMESNDVKNQYQLQTRHVPLPRMSLLGKAYVSVLHVATLFWLLMSLKLFKK